MGIKGEMMRRFSLKLVLFVLMMGLVLAGRAGRCEEASISVGYIPIGDCLQLYVAQDMGFFKEEGLVVEMKPLKGGAVIAPAVESGDIQIGWSNSVSIIIAHDKGFGFRFLTPGAFESEDHRVHSLLVREGSPIHQASDLEGKRVAINTLGNINELSITAYADRNGAAPKKIQFVEVPFPDMEAALKNGSVDAILSVEPFVTSTMSHGGAQYLEKAIHRTFGDKFLIGSWFAKSDWVEKNPQRAAAFGRAIRKASEFIPAHPEKVFEILAANTKLSPDLISKITFPAFPPTLEKSDLQSLIDISARYGFISHSFDAGEIMAK